MRSWGKRNLFMPSQEALSAWCFFTLCASNLIKKSSTTTAEWLANLSPAQLADSWCACCLLLGQGLHQTHLAQQGKKTAIGEARCQNQNRCLDYPGCQLACITCVIEGCLLGRCFYPTKRVSGTSDHCLLPDASQAWSREICLLVPVSTFSLKLPAYLFAEAHLHFLKGGRLKIALPGHQGPLVLSFQDACRYSQERHCRTTSGGGDPASSVYSTARLHCKACFPGLFHLTSNKAVHVWVSLGNDRDVIHSSSNVFLCSIQS